jgi:hypothetical protein
MAHLLTMHGMMPMSTQIGKPVDNFSLTAGRGPGFLSSFFYSQCKLIL